MPRKPLFDRAITIPCKPQQRSAAQNAAIERTQASPFGEDDPLAFLDAMPNFLTIEEVAAILRLDNPKKVYSIRFPRFPVTPRKPTISKVHLRAYLEGVRIDPKPFVASFLAALSATLPRLMSPTAVGKLYRLPVAAVELLPIGPRQLWRGRPMYESGHVLEYLNRVAVLTPEEDAERRASLGA